MITVCNSRHFGAAGYYAQMAAKQGLIGMAMCNVRPLAVAAGGQEPVFGTNPIAMSAPIDGEHAFLLDIATTAVAGGKLEIANRQHKRIPFGWALDAERLDTDDPLALKKNGALLPLGSHAETGAHKGYGLGLMVDILCGPLSGLGSGLFSNQLVGESGQWFAAWRIDAFRDPDEFSRDMQRMIDYIHASKPNKGVASVLVPGDPEAKARCDREANGIPLDEETVEDLRRLARKIDIPAPMPIN
jgi:LDH2 family malate/lactate/ureidoglycolate dehydrogenase